MGASPQEDLPQQPMRASACQCPGQVTTAQPQGSPAQANERPFLKNQGGLGQRGGSEVKSIGCLMRTWVRSQHPCVGSQSSVTPVLGQLGPLLTPTGTRHTLCIHTGIHICKIKQKTWAAAEKQPPRSSSVLPATTHENTPPRRHTLTHHMVKTH